MASSSSSSSSSVFFSVRRQEAVAVVPSKPTPYEWKPLSDIDDQQRLRYKMTTFRFYRYSPAMSGRDPAKVVKEAVAKALVFYYPLAGRLREGPDGKLVVECTAEGIQFCEADADAPLHVFGDMPQPPFPCERELCYDADEPGQILDCPLLLVQVTRFNCGGFLMGTSVNHTIMDGPGAVQFLEAVTEMARGLDAPTTIPVWARQVLTARQPPRITHAHVEYEKLGGSATVFDPTADDLVRMSFFFTAGDVSALKARLPPHLSSATRLDVLAACIWRSMSRSLYSGVPPGDQVQILVAVNIRGKSIRPMLPKGYYGNAFAFAAARSTRGELGSSPLGYAVQLVREAKSRISDGYLQSVADLMVLRGRPRIVDERTCVVADMTNAGHDKLDLGWGKPLFSGWAKGAVWTGSGVTGSLLRSRNAQGEIGVLAPMVMPRTAMEKFAAEMESIIKVPTKEEINNNDDNNNNNNALSPVPAKL